MYLKYSIIDKSYEFTGSAEAVAAGYPAHGKWYVVSW